MAEAEKACEEGTEEYESDLDDGPLAAARRREAASDDDEEEEEEEEGGGGSRRGSPPPSTAFGSESDDSGGHGAAELYDDEEVYDTEAEVVDVEYEDESEMSEAAVGDGVIVNGEVEVSLAADEGKYEDHGAAAEGDEEEEAATKRVGVKKASDSELYAVPTAGAFYQHDNRFQGQEDGNHGYQRQIFDGRKIWDPKEEAVWAHDLFNKISFHDSKHGNASIMQNVDNDYCYGSKSYYATKSVQIVKQTQIHSYCGNAKGYNDERNMYREKCSRTNQSRQMTSISLSAQNNSKSYYRSQDAKFSYNAGTEKHSCQRSLQHEQDLPCNQIFRSNKSSGPPPFYSAARSSHRELPFMQREKTRRVTFSKLFSSAVHKAHLQHEQTLPCKQTFGSNISSAPPSFYSSRSSNQQHCTQPCNAIYQQRSVQPILPTPRDSTKIFVQKFTSTNKIQSHPQTTLVSSSGDGEATAPPESNSSVVVSAVTGHDDMNEAERNYFLDGGSLVLGNTGARGSMLDDPGSSNTTAKLPVMLFNGLHPRGPGFPSNAMILLEFVDQQRGGNSEMRLMTCESRSPILTGATGVQEGAIIPPYFGSNCPQHSELESSLASPSDHGVKKDPISLTFQDPMSLTYQKIPAEVKDHESVHLQNRTRRYSEMSFAS